MNINLRHLRAFVAVAHAQSITRAAEVLDTSQSRVSTSLRDLESSLGLRLFDRHTRMLRLTDAGAELLPSVKRLLEDLQSVINNTSEIANLGRGRVAIAAPTLQSAIWLPGVIEEYTRLHPKVRVILHDVPEHEIQPLLRAGTVDMGITTATDSSRDLRTHTLYGDQYLAVMHASHPLARKREISWRDLAALQVIGSLPDNPVRTFLDRALAAEGMSLNYAYEVALPWTRLGLAAAKLGVAISTSTMRPVAIAMGLEVRPVTRPSLGRDLILMVSRDRSLSPGAERLRDLLLLRRPGAKSPPTVARSLPTG